MISVAMVIVITEVGGFDLAFAFFFQSESFLLASRASSSCIMHESGYKEKWGMSKLRIVNNLVTMVVNRMKFGKRHMKSGF